MKKYALEYSGYDFDYYFNLGDDIQTLAAVRLLGGVDGYISREQLNNSDALGLVSLNGFFMGSENWPPHKSIVPVFYSFHLDKNYESVVCSEEGVKYLKKHAPIGCRDIGTMNILKKYGIDAFYSGCLTLTLPKRKVRGDHSPGKVFIVGVKKELESIIPKSIKKDAVRVNQAKLQLPNISCDIRRKMAQEVLDGYAKDARLVITSKIHCAMPCLAMGIPVVFLYPKDEKDDYRVHIIEDYIPINYVSRSSAVRRLRLQEIVSSKVNWNPSVVDFENKKKEIEHGYFKAIEQAKNKLI